MCSWGIHITRKIIEGMPKCKIIAVGSVGTDMVDVAAATENGIVVTNTPDVFIEETADHTLMLLLGAFRRIKMMDDMVRNNEWKKGRPVLVEFPRLWGLTLGLFSFGNIATGNSFNPNETPLYTVMDADGKKATFGTELTGK